MGKFSKDNQPDTGGEGDVIVRSNKRRKYITDALSVALNRRADEILDDDGKPTNLEDDGKTRKKLQILADRLVDDAIDGDNVAAKEVLDRTEGKAPQAMEFSGPGGGPIENKWIVEVVDAKIDDNAKSTDT